MKEYRFSEQETKEFIGGFAKLHRMAVAAGELAAIVKLHLVPSEKDAFPVMQRCNRSARTRNSSHGCTSAT